MMSCKSAWIVSSFFEQTYGHIDKCGVCLCLLLQGHGLGGVLGLKLC